MASERLSDEELAEAFEHAHGSLRLTAALIELRDRRAADRTHIGRVSALAQALPVDEEADRLAARAMAERHAKQSTRKLGSAADDAAVRVVHGQDGGTFREVYMTFREMDALEWLVKHLRVMQMEGVPPRGAKRDALEALDKLLGKGAR